MGGGRWGYGELISGTRAWFSVQDHPHPQVPSKEEARLEAFISSNQEAFGQHP